jgi:glutamate-5-semialdehyde dehydrogenase
MLKSKGGKFLLYGKEDNSSYKAREDNSSYKARRNGMSYLEQLGSKAKRAATALNLLQQEDKNKTLKSCAQALIGAQMEILAANDNDVKAAISNGVKSSLIDRLRLTPDRLKGMADGLLEICDLKDPIGEVLSMTVRPNGLMIGQKVVPLGVVGIIYESRPNVTADAFGLCFKTGNAVILRGGSDAIHSNIAIVKALRNGLTLAGCNEDAVQLIEDTSREVARDFMRLNRYIDVLIPRGGAGLIRSVVENSTIPVIETGSGNCHVYVDEFADFTMALEIIDNAKTHRLGVCNACESLVLHEKISKVFLPLLYERFHAKEVEIRADERGCAICSGCVPATEEDYGTEYLDKIISLKVVNSIEEAIAHINHYSTKHSEAIVTKDYDHAMKFHNEIDSAAVYVNASTRFTDGHEFGFGAEIGISTQKLHARGPMGLNALTTTKYIIFGNGQTRK